MQGCSINPQVRLPPMTDCRAGGDSFGDGGAAIAVIISMVIAMAIVPNVECDCDCKGSKFIRHGR